MSSDDAIKTEVRKVVKAITPFLIPADQMTAARIEMPLSRQCRVEMKFLGHVDTAAIDALIAQLSVYRTWFVNDAPRGVTADELIHAITQSIEGAEAQDLQPKE